VKNEEFAMNTEKYNTLLFDFTDGIGHIIMNQPPSNMMTVEFFLELGQLVEKLKKSDGLRAIVISGQGRHFSSGAQLDELLNLANGGHTPGQSEKVNFLRDFLKRNFESFLYFEKVNIPVISAIRGVCLGSALEFALFSHYRFCGEDAVFGLPETTFNLLPGIGGISRVALLSGKSRTLELVLRGNTFSAEEALKLKIVDKILPKKKVVELAVDFAGSIINDYRKGKEKLFIQKKFI
jgi:enoyl-CoA hydratase/carnithine racemase